MFKLKKNLKSSISFALIAAILICSMIFTTSAIESIEIEETDAFTIPVFLLKENGEIITTMSACDHPYGWTGKWDTSVEKYHDRAPNGSYCIASAIAYCDRCGHIAWYNTGRTWIPCPDANKASSHI